MESPQQGNARDKEQNRLKKLEVPEYKQRLAEPMPYWKEFYKQKQALDHLATLDKEDLHIFGYELEDKPSTGKRKFVVTTYAQLWHNIEYLFNHNQPAAYYEIIPEGAACKLYFDLEFQKEFNPKLDGVAMVSDLIKLVCSKLDQDFKISCTSQNVIILEASTDSKFSTHLIFNLPGAVFKDNIHVGYFVQQLCDDIRKTSNSETESTEETPAKRAKMDLSSYGTFFVKNKDEKVSLFIDEGVYTKYRNFRLHKCVKLGKGNPLVLSKNSQYVIKMPRGKVTSEGKKLFLDSLITNVNSESRILTYERKSQRRKLNFGDSPHSVPGSSQTPTKNSVKVGYGDTDSPFPELDVFVRSILTKGGVQGYIRQWKYYEESRTMLYKIINNRWCENIGRAHKSNNIMIIVNLRRRTFYQKCYDPDCQKVNFKSQERPVPQALPPYTLYLSVEGKKVDGTIVAFENEEINITCDAKGASPKANLAWKINDQAVGSVDTDIIPSKTTNDAYDSESTLRFKPKVGDKKIACVSTLGESDIEQVENASLVVYVLPSLDLFVDDRSISNKIIQGYVGEDLVITCHASGALPPAHLTWQINDVPMNIDTNDLEFRNDDGSFDSTSILRFRPQSDHKSIACVNTVGEVYRTQVVRAILVFEGIQIPYIVIWVAVPVCFVAVLVIVLNIVCCIVKKLRGNQAESTNVDLSLLASATKTITDSPSGSRKTPREGIKTSLQGPQNLELPKIPTDVEEHEYSEYEKMPSELVLPVPGQKYAECDDAPSASYSTTLTDVTQAKIFYGQEMRKLKKIKSSKLYDRWTGTINLTEEKNKRVVFTTVTEAVLSSNKVHWDKFVKRGVQLPESKHLIHIEGIGIDNGRQYLIHEYLAWKTLNARIKATPKTGVHKASSKPMSPSEVMRLILGILEGMEVVQSSGFLHPGLSTKKILLSNQGICKLYDFCLSEDAVNILTIKKPLTNYSLNELAPEGIQRNKYSSASDVWSTAVVFWEILSGGSLPFGNDNDASSKSSNKLLKSPPQKWPEKYQQLSNKRLFACWDHNESLRPTINELRLSFQEILKSVDTYNLPQVYGGSMAGCYLPMKEATKLNTKL